MQKSKLSLAILTALCVTQVQANTAVELDGVTVTANRVVEVISK